MMKKWKYAMMAAATALLIPAFASRAEMLPIGMPSPLVEYMLVCQTYVTPCLMKSWSVSFGDFHPSGRIGKQL